MSAPVVGMIQRSEGRLASEVSPSCRQRNGGEAVVTVALLPRVHGSPTARSSSLSRALLNRSVLRRAQESRPDLRVRTFDLPRPTC